MALSWFSNTYNGDNNTVYYPYSYYSTVYNIISGFYYPDLSINTNNATHKGLAHAAVVIQSYDTSSLQIRTGTGVSKRFFCVLGV